MSILYVYSGAAGAANGTSWTDAYTTVQAALTVWTTADEIWAADDHAETPGASTITWTCGNATPTTPAIVKRVNRTTNVYDPTTGSDTKNVYNTGGGSDIVFNLSIAMYGLYLECGDDYTSSITSDNAYVHFEDCKFNIGITGTSSRWDFQYDTILKAVNCTFNLLPPSAGDEPIMAHFDAKAQYIGCTFTGTQAAAGLLIFSSLYSQQVHFIDCDFSALTNTILVDSSTGDAGCIADVIFSNCLLAGSMTLTDGTINSSHINVLGYGCHTAGNTFNNSAVLSAGSIDTSTSVYLASGYADYDGTTNLSQLLTPGSLCTPSYPLESFPIAGIVESTGSKTFTIELVENYTTALTQQDLWVELYYLGGASSVVHTVDTSSREVAALAYTDLVAGSGVAAWAGEPAGSRSVKVDITATVNQKGLYYAVVKVGKYEAGKVVHINPKMSIA